MKQKVEDSSLINHSLDVISTAGVFLFGTEGPFKTNILTMWLRLSIETNINEIVFCGLGDLQEKGIHTTTTDKESRGHTCPDIQHTELLV